MNGYISEVDYNNVNYYNPTAVPRSTDYSGKTIESEGNTERHGIKYYHRVFADGCAELVRYDGKAKMWAILCFPNEDQSMAG